MVLQSQAPDRADSIADPAIAGQDLRGFGRILRRRALTVLLTLALVMGLVMLALWLIRPLYTASSQVLLDPRDRQILQTEVAPSGLGADQALVESQVRLLTSDAVFSRVIASEGLLADPEFGAIDPASPTRRLRALLLGPSVDTTPAEVRALTALRRLVSVRRSERTYVVEIRASSRSADKARRIADAIPAAYIADQSDADTTTTRRATAALTGRLEELRAKVNTAEKAVEEYRRQNNLPMAEGHLLGEQQMSELSNRLGLARSRTAEAQARHEQVQRVLRKDGDGSAMTDALNSNVITNLRGQLAEITRREAEMLQRLGPRHPGVQDVRAEVANIRGLIAEELRRVASAARNDYEVAKANEDSLSRSFERLRSQTFDAGQAQVRLRELQREAEASRSVYEAFLTRAKQTSEQERIQTPQARIIAPAMLPHETSWPPRLLLLALGLVSGLGLGVALAIARDHFDDRPQAPADVQRLTGLEVLASLPARGRNAKDIIDAQQTPMARAVRQLRNELRDNHAKEAGQSLLVTSVVEDYARAALSLDLGLAMAAAGERVLMLDLDTTSRALSRRVAPTATRGLAEVLAGSISLDDALVKDPRTGLHALPLAAGGAVLRPSSGEIARLLGQALAKFDVVLLDAPAVNTDGTARMAADCCDEAILLVDAGKARREDILDAVARMKGGSARLRGAVLSGMSARG